jgi:hypothetical protein
LSTILTESERALRRAADRLAQLSAHPSFIFLLHECEKKRDGMRRSLVARIEGGEDLVAMQRQSDYDRGFIDGMFYVKTVVEKAAEKLEEWDKAGVATESEETDGWARYDEDHSA